MPRHRRLCRTPRLERVFASRRFQAVLGAMPLRNEIQGNCLLVFANNFNPDSRVFVSVIARLVTQCLRYAAFFQQFCTAGAQASIPGQVGTQKINVLRLAVFIQLQGNARAAAEVAMSARENIGIERIQHARHETVARTPILNHASPRRQSASRASRSNPVPRVPGAQLRQNANCARTGSRRLLR